MKKRVLEVRWNDFKNHCIGDYIFKRFYNMRDLLDWVEDHENIIVTMKIIRQKKEDYDCK
jgi:hypothetical protein